MNRECSWKKTQIEKKKKHLAKRTASDKVLKDKALNIAKNPKCAGYQRGLASMVL